MNVACDYLIVGAGIIGLSIARELKTREPSAKITLLEKELRLGVHASGRNSGVLHTGIYYPPGTLKARLCKAGADAMFAYAEAHGIPVRRDGKVIVATSMENAQGLDALLANAKAAGISAGRVNADEIRQIEPHARAEFGGIYCKDTAVIDSPRVLDTLSSQLSERGARIEYGQNRVVGRCELRTGRGQQEIAVACGVVDKPHIVVGIGLTGRFGVVHRAGRGVVPCVDILEDLDRVGTSVIAIRVHHARAGARAVTRVQADPRGAGTRAWIPVVAFAFAGSQRPVVHGVSHIAFLTIVGRVEFPVGETYVGN